MNKMQTRIFNHILFALNKKFMENKNKIKVKLTHNNDAFEDPKIKKLYFKFGFETFNFLLAKVRM